MAGCATPSPSTDGTGAGDSTGDSDGDTGDGDPTGDGDSTADGVPYRTAGVLWSEVGRIKLALYDSESGWDAPIDVNPPEHHGIDVAMEVVGAIEDTGVMVLWDMATAMWARRYDQDLGWEDPTELDPTTPFRFAHGVIALPDGRTLAIWRQSPVLENGTYTFAYSCRDNEGTWGPVVPTDNPRIRVKSRQDGTLVVFDASASADGLVAQVFNQGGGDEWCSQPLSEPTSLNPISSVSMMPPIQDRGGSLIHAVWRADTGQIEAAYFDPQTSMWSAPTLLPIMVNPPTPDGNTIIGAQDGDGNAWVVSDDVSTPNTRLRAHRFDAGLRTWSDTILLDEPDRDLYQPALAISPGGDLFVAAQISEADVEDSREIVGFAWSDAEQHWSEPIVLGATNESYSLTFVEIEPESGDVFVAWTHDNDAYLMHFDAQAQTWSDQVFPTAFDQHSVRFLRAIGNGEVLLLLHDSTLDFPNSIGTITALVHGADGWGPEQVLTSNANVGLIRPFVANP